ESMICYTTFYLVDSTILARNGFPYRDTRPGRGKLTNYRNINQSIVSRDINQVIKSCFRSNARGKILVHYIHQYDVPNKLCSHIISLYSLMCS
ncbi:hypothetical protein M8C21_028924, partial [Ambrosia artemisiifolia]